MQSYVLYILVLSVWYWLALVLFSRHWCGVFGCLRSWYLGSGV